MRTLASLESMNDNEIQNWLRKVDPTALAIALLGSDDVVRDCVFRNMSKRAAALMGEDIGRYVKMDARELIIQANASRLEALF
jgi:flagellar motor switch protein FliG